MLGHDLLWRYGGKIGLNSLRLGKVEAVFARYGPVTVGFARFFNVLRQLNGVIAGTLEMDWRRFLMFNALGGVLWVLVWTLAGLYLGFHETDIAALMHELGFLGAIIGLTAPIVIPIYAYRHQLLARLRHDNGSKSKDN